VAFSMPSIITARGVEQVLDMRLDPDEERQLEVSAAALLATQASLGI
jgi:malate/lactate dehydrogenase